MSMPSSVFTPKADRDALEGEMDGIGANWQLLEFGGRLHSFSEEETMMKDIAEFNARAAHETYRMLDDFIRGEPPVGLAHTLVALNNLANAPMTACPSR